MTPTEYAANVQARFPKCFTASGIAIPAELARRESAARLRAIGQSPLIVHNPSGVTSRTPETEARRIAKLQASLAEKTTETRKRILATLSKPMTANDVANAVSLSRYAVSGHLAHLLGEGKVTRTFLRRVAVWAQT